MTRDQALAIVENYDLILHFAMGGEIFHSTFPQPSNIIILSNMKAGRDTLYRKGRVCAEKTMAEETHRVT